MARNKFTNPATGENYTWPKNHDQDGEDDSGKSLTVTRIPNTANGLSAWQQGDDGPYVLKWKGSIVHREHLRQMWHWYAISKGHTIYLTDFDNQQYEGIISSFMAHRKGKLTSVGRDASMLTHTYVFSFEFTVVRFKVGDMKDMGVQP